MRIRIVLPVILTLLSSGIVFSLTASEVYKKVGPSVYPVYGFDAETGQRTASGTGIAVSAQLLATNCHIVNEANSYRVKINSSLKTGKLVYKDLSHDLCFLEVPDHQFQPVSFRRSLSVDIGEDVYAIGNPHGLEKSISRGIISNKHKFFGGALLQTDATISFGSSGGGLFDVDGNLIGITRAGHRYKDIAFAVPSEWISDILQAAKSKQHAQGLNITIADLMKKNSEKIPLTVETVGRFGQDEISVYRYQNHCFFAFQGKVDNQAGGVMFWYPEKRMMVYYVPYENTVLNAMRLMIRNGYVSQATGNLVWNEDDHNSAIPIILQSIEVVTKEFDVDPQVHFSESNEVLIHYPDYRKDYQEIQIRFGMMGFNKAYDAFLDRCVEPKN